MFSLICLSDIGWKFANARQYAASDNVQRYQINSKFNRVKLNLTKNSSLSHTYLTIIAASQTLERESRGGNAAAAADTNHYFRPLRNRNNWERERMRVLFATGGPKYPLASGVWSVVQ